MLLGTASIIIIGVIVFYIFFYHEWRHHIRCVMTIPFGNTFKIVKFKWVIQTNRTFDDKSGKKSHTYNLNLEKAIFNKKNNPMLYYDINKTEPIDFSNKIKGKGESSNLYNTILKDRSAEEALNKNQNKNMLLIIMILVIIIVAVGAYGQYQAGQANDKLITLTKYYTQALINATKSGGGIIVK